MTAVTALTAQNTEGVHDVLGVDPAFIATQMEVVLDDLGADALKTGMLHNAAVIQAVARVIAARAGDLPLVLDPVMFAKGGHALLEPDAVAALKGDLMPRAHVVTPNIPEAEAIADMEIRSVADMQTAAARIAEAGPDAVLVKGGHLEGNRLTDVLLVDGRVETFSDNRIETRHTHGTGCTLASAIATGLAQGLALTDAVVRARAYVREAIRTAPGFGRGHGPLNHGHPLSGSGGKGQADD
jgi:hydroxymethylpyrimidine/phosphomethylpyrimidine kinase